jgi:predicted MFS family arabinose efflux permease
LKSTLPGVGDAAARKGRRTRPRQRVTVLSFPQLLRQNRNYRYTWFGQIVSEIGDHFNTIAVFSLALQHTGSGFVVSGILLARAVSMIVGGPIAGVVLDRMDRKHVMIVSDLLRAVVALVFVVAVEPSRTWMLYPLSGLLMFFSPFFTSGRTAILPTIASSEELHTANSLTQTTGYASVTLGTLLGGLSAAGFGFEIAFVLNAVSFLFSAWMVGSLRVPQGHFRPAPKALNETMVARPWHEYQEGLRYMRATPLFLGIALVHVGWATGGGTAQVLFSLFGEQVFHRGPIGIGMLWSSAGVGLLVGGFMAHRWGPQLSFTGFKRTIVVCHLMHGLSYLLFSQAKPFWLAMFFIGLSRVGLAVSAILNQMQLLRHVADAYRGRVFSTVESMTWATMMFSMTAVGFASEYWNPRQIGAVAGMTSSLTAFGWGWAHLAGKLPEPALKGVDPDEIEFRGAPRA